MNIAKVINPFGKSDLEVFSIHNTERESKVFGNLVKVSLTGETRLNKLKEILNLENLSETDREQVFRLLRKHADRFQLEDEELSTTNVTKHRINTQQPNKNYRM